MAAGEKNITGERKNAPFRVIISKKISRGGGAMSSDPTAVGGK